MAVSNKHRNGRKASLAIGVSLIMVGVLCVLIPSSQMFVSLLVRFWPVVLILFGAFRVFAFLRKGHPRSPIGGALLVGIGGLFLINNFTNNNAFQVYGRFWPFLLLAFGLGELIFQYSRRGAGMIAPPVITVGKMVVVASLITTGVLSSRIAKTNPNFLSAAMPSALSEFRDAIFGSQFNFSDAAVEFPFTQNSKINVNNGYGDIEVQPASGNTMSITLNKGVRAYDQATAADINTKIKIQVNKTDSGYTVTTNRDEIRSNIQTNIVIKVPKNAIFQIQNRYGHISVRGLTGNQDLNNAHGSVEISDVQGQVKIVDSFGTVSVYKSGSLDIENTHGSITAREVAGDVTVNARYYDLTIGNVDGAAKISGSQGTVKLNSIKGSVSVEGEHVDVDGHNLQADAKISSTHCSITLNGVVGDTLISAPHANIDASDITGSLTVQDEAHGRINARRIKGAFNINGIQTSVTAANISGPAVIETSHARVEVSDFTGSMKCTTSYERVILAPTATSFVQSSNIVAKPSLKDIDVDNDRGEIRLNLPANVDFQVNATANHGRVVTSGLPLVAVSERNYLSGIVGNGGPNVRLSTSYANVVITKTTETTGPTADTNQ